MKKRGKTNGPKITARFIIWSLPKEDANFNACTRFQDEFHIKIISFFFHFHPVSQKPNTRLGTYIITTTKIIKKNVSFSKFVKHDPQNHDMLTSFARFSFKVSNLYDEKTEYRGFSGECKIGELSEN